ncbi:hypothetical protein Q0Z83_019440 [Actinoplanes sichuanensis]|uniref:IclR family transcriptional regulator n=1 Tax=Actinoplanes sichuanensis TaxID=512349 RepID=A0ABW4AIV3_9ACTN|nr:helix-turn-helix domain-containing protein [Actinoplanes sichuanensis]BEL03753.1 hypothetical protein Q0Z83_019440 [Actinoplanes sichuanensis]
MNEGQADSEAAKGHRTIDRVTQILEEVVYRPGIGFAELARALDAPKSSVHGFIRGLLAKGWLYEVDKRFYLGPAVYALTLASGNIRAGHVTQADLDALHQESKMTVFLGVQAGDHLIYIGESGTDAMTGFAARSNIRRRLIDTAGGKALLAIAPAGERDAYLRRQDGELVSEFLAQFPDIAKSGVARNFRHHGAQMALASVVRDRAGKAVAVAILVGSTAEAEPRESRLRRILLKHVELWAQHVTTPREAL